MKKRGTIGVLLLGIVLFTFTGCGSDNGEKAGQQSEDDSNVSVTVDGNLEASRKIELTFGSGGKVEKIYVREGDKVSEGDILAELDTSTLELALAKAKVVRAEAELTVDKAVTGVIQAQAGVSQAQVTLVNSEIALEFARETYSVTDIKVAEANVDIAQRNFDEALWVFAKYDEGTPGYDKYQEVVLQAEAGLKAAKDTLNAMLSGYDVKEVTSKILQVKSAEKSVELSEQALNVAEKSLELAEKSLGYASQSVDLALKQLNEAVIKAPFDGTIYKISVKEGEFISPGAYTATVIIGIVDLTSMELVARVDEFDIAKIRIEQKVMIDIEALPEVRLEGEVAYISPITSESDGVLLFEDEDDPKEYKVRINFNIQKGLPIKAGMSATAEIVIE